MTKKRKASQVEIQGRTSLVRHPEPVDSTKNAVTTEHGHKWAGRSGSHLGPQKCLLTTIRCPDILGARLGSFGRSHDDENL